MSRAPTTCLLTLALAACVPERPPLTPSPAAPVVGGEVPTSVVVDANAGAAPLVTWARALNAFGAAVPSEAVSLRVDGAPVSVDFDGTGYGQVRVAGPGRVAITGGTEAVDVVAFASDWPGFGANEAQLPPLTGAERAVAVSTGVVVQSGADLVWMGPGGRGHRVLQADGPILGLRAVFVDVDDVLDVVAWSQTTVFVLRGRPNGGMAWANGYTAPGFTVAGADAGDLNGDSLADLALAWASTGEGPSQLDVWNGDGIFGFQASEPRNLPDTPMSLSIGDNTGEGTAQVTVLDMSGAWTRYIAGSETQYMPIGPRSPEQVVIPVGASIDATGDVNADRGDELWLYGPRAPRQARTITLVDLRGDAIEFVPTSASGAHIARGDGDGDEVIDLFTLQDDDRSLRSLSFAGGSYVPRRLEELPEHAPIALFDWHEQDQVLDLFLAGDTYWRWWRGDNAPNDPSTFWGIRDPDTRTLTETADGPIGVAELDRDPATVDVVTFEVSPAETSLVVRTVGAGVTATLGSLAISSAGTTPVDVAICDGFAYVALPGELVRVDLRAPSNPTGLIVRPLNASRVACGAGPGGAVAAALVDDTVRLFSAALGELDSVPGPSVQDVAIGDVGAGPELRTCESPGCGVAWWPYGAAGEAAFAVVADGSIAVQGATPGPTVLGAGHPSVADVDGDSLPDLLVASPDGVVTLVRSLGTDTGPAEVVHVLHGLVGAVGAGDADGDGWSDLVFVDGAGDVRFTVAPWSPAEEAEAQPTTDTGVRDTGVRDTGVRDTGPGDTGGADTGGSSSGTTP